MAERKTLEAALKKLDSFSARLLRAEQEIRKLKDLMNVHDNWNAQVRGLIGERVQVCDRCGLIQEGVLLWSDRYNLCVEIKQHKIGTYTQRRIYTKGGINWIGKY